MKSNIAFTLVELLVVIAIMVLMMTLAIPAFNAIKGGGDVTKASYDIQGILDQARAYAMANNTYVFVGIAEVDASVDASVTPQVTNSSTPYGRIALAVVASKDGTRGYNPNSASTSWTANYSNYNGITTPGANLLAISKLQHFENLHLAPLFSSIPNSGGTTRPTVSSTSYQIGNTACVSVTPFAWPLGTALNSTSAQYNFVKVINFDPQGVARIQYSGSPTIAQYMDLGLIPTHGNVLPPIPVTTGNCAAIQIDGMTGSTRIYRP